MRLRLSDAAYAARLALALRRCDCVVMPAGADTLTVVNPVARDDDEARTELLFFLRAWQARHPGVTIHVL